MSSPNCLARQLLTSVPNSGEELKEEVPVVDHLVFEVGVFVPKVYDFAPGAQNGVQE